VAVRLVILDRDGVINVESDAFVKSADEWTPIAGSLEGVRLLSGAGFTVAVASNQSGLGRGLFDSQALEQMHEKMRRLVSEAGGRIDHIVVCPHHPDDGCDCRKPKPGLLRQLSDYYQQPLAGVPVIGDSVRDIEAAQAVAARPILVRTGNGSRAEAELRDSGIEVCSDLLAAARMLAAERS
jgi:D-glycero-D-manno-heptose 1,7-bisphosphate phosphatase